ncbi:hypothetical protein H9P43_001627 [Blastocladiella emersonii ATCC 22665]|nr:hypothetical protein H9P43_001627 [Blastocladiella emersonii ATCC 22665]
MEHQHHPSATPSPGPATPARAASPSSFFYEIDASHLRRSANRPRHVAQRFDHAAAADSPAAAWHLHCRRPSSDLEHAASSGVDGGASSPEPAPLITLASSSESSDDEPALALPASPPRMDAAAVNRLRLLEARRAKLADHHGRVRVVADAVAEARITATRSARAEMERTLRDAERNRIATLEDKARMCAREVRKAKEIARRAHARDAATAAEVKRSLEDKLRASSWRRQQIRKVPRASLAEPNAFQNAMRVRAATEIQEWWRGAKVAPVVNEFRKLVTPKPAGAAAAAVVPKPAPAPKASTQDSAAPATKKRPAAPATVPASLRGVLVLDHLAALPFPAAAAVFQKQTVIRVTSRFLHRLKKTAVDPPDLGKTPTRVFLTVFMLLTHRDAIIEDADGPIEKELLGTATALMAALDTLLGATGRNAPLSAAITGFLQAWFAYHTTFESFKSKDTQGVIDNLVAHATELARLLDNVSGNSEITDAEWRPSIIKQLKVMRLRLLRVGGEPALAQLAQVLDAEGLAHVLDEQTARSASPTRDMEAAAAANDSVLLSSPAKRTLLRGPSPAPAPEEVPGPTVQAPATTPLAAAALPPQDAIPDQLQEILANHALAHEVVMDPHFELRAPGDDAEDASANPMARAVRAAAQRAFADQVNEMVAAGNYAFLPDLVAEVRDALLAMVVPNGGSPKPGSSAAAVAASLQDVLDPSAVRAEWSRTGRVDVAALLGTIVQCMLRLAAPARDADIHALLGDADASVGQTVVRIHAVLARMRVDLANFHLQQLRPVLQARAVEYEAHKFAEYMASSAIAGRSGIEKTEAWLGAAARDLLSTSMARNPEGVPLNDLTRPKFEDVYHEALLGLVSPAAATAVAVTPDNVPETLALDARRLHAMQNAAQAVAIAGALVMVARNAFPWFRNATATVDAPAAPPLPGTQRRATPSTAPRVVPAAHALADRLMVLLTANDTPTAAHLAAAVMHAAGAAMPGSASAAGVSPMDRLSDEQRALVKTLVAKTLSARDPVLAIVSRRVHASLRTFLGMAAAAAPATAAAAVPPSGVRLRRDSLTANGLDAVEEHLNALGARLAALARHNKAVYAQWYDAVLRRALGVGSA